MMPDAFAHALAQHAKVHCLVGKRGLGGRGGGAGMSQATDLLGREACCIAWYSLQEMHTSCTGAPLPSFALGCPGGPAGVPASTLGACASGFTTLQAQHDKCECSAHACKVRL